MMYRVVSLVLLFSVLLVGISFVQTSYAASHPFELEWGVSGQTEPGMFLYPQHLAIDLENNVYVTDLGNSRVQKFDDQGNYIRSWGSHGSEYGQFSQPSGIAVANGYVFVVDNGLNTVQKFDSFGNFVMQWGVFGNGDGDFRSPNGIAISDNGFVYVVDTGNSRIQKFTFDGEYVSMFGQSGKRSGNFITPIDITINQVGELFVTDFNNARINVYNENGKFLRSLDSSIGGFKIGPSGITLDKYNNIYFSDQKNNRIIQVNEFGIPFSIFGVFGQDESQFQVPMDVAIDNNGFLYVTDSLGHRIQKFTTPMVSDKLIVENEQQIQEPIEPIPESVEPTPEPEVVESEIDLPTVKPIPNDFTKPVITVPDDLVIEAIDALTSVDIGQATADDESGILSLSNNAAESFPLGITTVIWTAIDGSGNMAIASQTIIVQDTTLPEIEQLPEITLEAKSETQNLVELEIPYASDAVGIIAIENNAPEVFPLGETIVTWTVTDVMKNISTMEQKITLIDSIPPRIDIPDDIIIEAISLTENKISLIEPEVFDDVKIEFMSNDSPQYFPLGETIVTWMAADSSGNIATSLHKIMVVDTVPPEIFLTDVSLEGVITTGSNIPLVIPQISDLQQVSITNDAPDVIPFGDTIVTWTATDESGNISTSRQVVSIVDTSKPILLIPNDIEIEATAVDTIIDDLGESTVEDISGISSVTNDAPEVFPLGETIVTWTATDNAGNSVSETQLVTVVDTTAPKIIAPSDINFEAVDSHQNYIELDNARFSDSVEIKSVVNNAPEVFPLGETIVTWTATDISGNSASDTQKIIIKDTISPVVNGPENIILEVTDISGIQIAIGQAYASDQVDKNPKLTNDAPELFQLGDTIVTWTATDNAGNSALFFQTVSIVDTIAPELTPPENIIQEAEDILSNFVIIGNPETSDIVNVSSIENNAPEVFPLGDTIVTWTATDNAGNSVSETQLITVVDTTAPSVEIPENITAEATGLQDNIVELDVIIADDNVGVTLITNDAPKVFQFGLTTVTWTISDDAGNIATIQQEISLVDTTVPSIIVPSDIMTEAVSNDSNIVDIGFATGSDSIQLAEITNDAPEVFPLGETIVTWTATDNAGNSVSETQLVTVVDTTAPSISQLEDIVADATSSTSNTIELISPIADDIISGIIIDNDAPNVFPFGETIVTWTVEDESGNVSYIDHKVIIVDNSPPELQTSADVIFDATSLESIIEIESPQISDIIDVRPEITNNAPEVFPLGETIVTWTATDNAGNSVSETQLVTVQICGNSPSYYNFIMGTAEDDFLMGTTLPDLIFGYGGDDIIIGNNGNDCIFAGEGSDIIFGNNGDDNIRAGQGNDIVKGNSGADILKGELGLDMIDGGDDIDTCLVIDEQNSDLVIKCEAIE